MVLKNLITSVKSYGVVKCASIYYVEMFKIPKCMT